MSCTLHTTPSPPRRRVARLAPLPPRVSDDAASKRTVFWDRRSAICGFGLKNLAISRAAAFRTRGGSWRSARSLSRLGFCQAARVAVSDARPLDEFLGPAVDVFLVFVAALPEASRGVLRRARTLGAVAAYAGGAGAHRRRRGETDGGETRAPSGPRQRSGAAGAGRRSPAPGWGGAPGRVPAPARAPATELTPATGPVRSGRGRAPAASGVAVTTEAADDARDADGEATAVTFFRFQIFDPPRFCQMYS